MGSTLLCGPFSKWPLFENIAHIEAFFNVTPLCRFRGITHIRIKVVLFDFIWDALGYKIMGHSQNIKRLKASSYKKVESNKQSIFTVTKAF